MAELYFGTLYDTKVPGSSSATVNARMSWVPCPDTGMGAGAEGYSELLDFENGGADVVSSAATHRVYDLEWGTRSGSGTAGLDVIRSYQQGVFGPGLIYFADPMNFTTNLFPPHWATPALSQLGWKKIYDGNIGTASYPTVAANVYNYPARAFASAAGAITKPTVAAHIAVIPIPPGFNLRVCFRSAPGAGVTGVIGYQAINLNGSYAASSTATVNEAGSAPVTIFSGNTYRAVEFWVAGGVTNLVSAMAWLHPVNAISVPNLSIAPHVPGAGHTGCKFTSAAIVENYVMTDRTLKGMSTQLTEVGAWQRSGT